MKLIGLIGRVAVIWILIEVIVGIVVGVGALLLLR